MTSYLSEMQSVRKIHCLYSALSFCVHHLARVNWSDPAMLKDGGWPSPPCDQELSVVSAPTPAAGTCRMFRSGMLAHLYVWWLCLKDSCLKTYSQNWQIFLELLAKPAANKNYTFLRQVNGEKYSHVNTTLWLDGSSSIHHHVFVRSCAQHWNNNRTNK